MGGNINGRRAASSRVLVPRELRKKKPVNTSVIFCGGFTSAAREPQLRVDIMGEQQVKPLADCRHFLAGRCLYGTVCMHRHDPEARARVIEAKADEAAAEDARADADAAFFACERRVNTLRREKAPHDVLYEAIRELDALKAARRALRGRRQAPTFCSARTNRSTIWWAAA